MLREGCVRGWGGAAPLTLCGKSVLLQMCVFQELFNRGDGLLFLSFN